MRPPWLRAAANALVVLSLLDGSLSLAEEILRAATGALWLLPLRNTLAQGVVLGVLASLPAMALTPRLPLAVFLPLAIGTLWLGFGAAPLGLLLASPTAVGISASTFQIALSVTVLLVIRRRNGGRRWLFDADSPGAPAFAWSRSLGFAAGSVALGAPAALLYLVVLGVTWVQTTTQGFVAFDLAGVSLGDRRYARGDREIRLVGMMHIGEERAYRDIVASFASPSTVVLAEGVSDREGRLGDALHYGRAAEALGLASQRDLRDYLAEDADPEAPPPAWPVIRPADLDANEFAAETIDWLRWASGVWTAPDLASALREILVAVRERGPEDLATFQRDVIDRRNAHLYDEIHAALEDYERVIVPWGALHLPAVENVVLGWGFEETSRTLHPLISWDTIAAALR